MEHGRERTGSDVPLLSGAPDKPGEEDVLSYSTFGAYGTAGGTNGAVEAVEARAGSLPLVRVQPMQLEVITKKL